MAEVEDNKVAGRGNDESPFPRPDILPSKEHLEMFNPGHGFRLPDRLPLRTSQRGSLRLFGALAILAIFFVTPALARVQGNTAPSEGRSLEQMAPALRRLKILSAATQIYTEKNAGQYPVAANAAQALRKILPYVKKAEDRALVNASLLKKADPKSAYLPLEPGISLAYHTKLSGANTGEVEYPAETPLWFEVVSNPEHSFGVTYADTHVRKVRASQRALFERQMKLLKPSKPRKGIGLNR